MSDFSLLPGDALVQLSEQVTTDSELPAPAALHTELSQRATAWCAVLDADSTRVCRLSNWSIRLSGSTRQHGAVILIGQAFGHPHFPDGTPIVTSPLEIILRTADGDLAVTQNRIYELSTVHPDLLAALLRPE